MKGTIVSKFLTVFAIVLTSVMITAHAKSNSSSTVPRFNDKGYTCSHLVYDYGVTSSAQAHCGFKKYSGDIVGLATQCFAFARQGGQGKALEDILTTGIEDFNQLIAESEDKKSVCRSVLKNFPQFVSR